MDLQGRIRKSVFSPYCLMHRLISPFITVCFNGFLYIFSFILFFLVQTCWSRDAKYNDHDVIPKTWNICVSLFCFHVTWKFIVAKYDKK